MINKNLSLALEEREIPNGKGSDIAGKLMIPHLDPEIFKAFVSIPKTTTILARDAIKQLEKAGSAVLKDAIDTIKPKVVASGLMNYLERKVKIGEVLGNPAKNWSDETRQDFASPSAFQMDKNKLEVMESIVSIAILNDSDLEEEILIENTPETTENDLLENRKIKWQYPAPGTPLDPPYVVLVAVEHADVTKAEDVVESIIGGLVDYQGYRVPKTVKPKQTRTFYKFLSNSSQG